MWLENDDRCYMFFLLDAPVHTYTYFSFVHKPHQQRRQSDYLPTVYAEPKPSAPSLFCSVSGVTYPSRLPFCYLGWTFLKDLRCRHVYPYVIGKNNAEIFCSVVRHVALATVFVLTYVECEIVGCWYKNEVGLIFDE